MGVRLEDIFESIKAICDKYDKTFAQVICEAFYIFDDDFEGMPVPEHPVMACRYYSDGIPTIEHIINKIKNIIKKEI